MLVRTQPVPLKTANSNYLKHFSGKCNMKSVFILFFLHNDIDARCREQKRIWGSSVDELIEEITPYYKVGPRVKKKLLAGEAVGNAKVKFLIGKMV